MRPLLFIFMRDLAPSIQPLFTVFTISPGPCARGTGLLHFATTPRPTYASTAGLRLTRAAYGIGRTGPRRSAHSFRHTSCILHAVHHRRERLSTRNQQSYKIVRWSDGRGRSARAASVPPKSTRATRPGPYTLRRIRRAPARHNPVRHTTRHTG